MKELIVVVLSLAVSLFCTSCQKESAASFENLDTEGDVYCAVPEDVVFVDCVFIDSVPGGGDLYHPSDHENVMDDHDKVMAAKTDLRNLIPAVKMFAIDTGMYPSEEVGLMALVEQPVDVTGWAGPYIRATELPKDAWGHDFVYMLDPGNGKPFVIISYGADGTEGGEGINADLWSTNLD